MSLLMPRVVQLLELVVLVKTTIKFLLGLVLIFLVFAGVIAQRIYTRAIEVSPLGRDIDFNGDSQISFFEAIDGAEIKYSNIIVNGKKCKDYSEPKTGSTWRVICEK
ncbi:hypothetical protein ABHF33_09625 [Chitinibacter sp. FCG-7]|uniref:Uncharacterized protein n=1 Tax=Chitinibacter mangrovi TaxID=3153927 RepID=A0AAU7F608_9NEIS